MPRAVITDVTTLPNAPDVTGWRAAMARLNVALGQEVVFEVPIDPVWPDVPLDPETGMPYDPTIVPLEGGGTTNITVRVGVVMKPVEGGMPEDPIFTGPSGIRRTENIALLVQEQDYEPIQTATGAVVNSVPYKLTETVPDGLVGIDRYVFYGEAR